MLGVRNPATPSQKIQLLCPEVLEASRGAGRTPGSLNLVKEAGQTKKEIKSIYDLLHRLNSTIDLW